ncbi:Fructosamine-3-kinase [Pseudonocardia thermophila]|uniref:Fructosamine-3-kinase n=1 Tax=Pseudonocardia thermophila TaxID=1848 RepID=A0A1M6TX40_PSETH|nr:fructosamine kinase family protein [Pseudonocardia thermophila]SHK61572.1 Fructosamine-3-kinase [Pseudonocardia thermophila]
MSADRVVVKHGDVRAEAAGLAWLVVPGGPPVVPVLEVHPDRLVLARLDEVGADPAAAERFGRQLAYLHAAGAPAFGAPPPGGPAEATIGRAPMRNEPAPAWPQWYVRDRVLPYLRAARDAGSIGAADTAAVEQVCERIAELAGPPEPPARLHGDLWSGNVLWTAEGGTLIDPAAHGGHRETDLAMLALFGFPYLDAVLRAYHETTPLADGWRERVPLHQLFPLLVHAVLFGAGYGRQAGAAARTVLATA